MHRWTACSLVALMMLLVLACSKEARRQLDQHPTIPVLVAAPIPVTVRIERDLIVISVGDSAGLRIVQGKTVEWTAGWRQVHGVGLNGNEFREFTTSVPR